MAAVESMTILPFMLFSHHTRNIFLIFLALFLVFPVGSFAAPTTNRYFSIIRTLSSQKPDPSASGSTINRYDSLYDIDTTTQLANALHQNFWDFDALERLVKQYIRNGHALKNAPQRTPVYAWELQDSNVLARLRSGDLLVPGSVYLSIANMNSSGAVAVDLTFDPQGNLRRADLLSSLGFRYRGTIANPAIHCAAPPAVAPASFAVNGKAFVLRTLGQLSFASGPLDTIEYQGCGGSVSDSLRYLALFHAPLVSEASSVACGNGIVEKGEKCDLGGSNGKGKGCLSTCTVQRGWKCTGRVGQPSTCTKK